MKQIAKTIPLFLILMCLNACEGPGIGWQTMGASEHGVLYNILPPKVGGGVQEKIIRPGEARLIMPWQRLYKISTALQSVTWGEKGEGDNKRVSDYLETRSLDGNEVGLAVTIRYEVIPEKVPHIVQYVGVNDLEVRKLVEALSRADIRTHINVLNTRGFLDPRKLRKAFERSKQALNKRLEPEGIKIRNVIYDKHLFERRLQNGNYDRSYQEQIDREQALNQQTEQELKRIRTVQEKKLQELEQARAVVNQKVEQAKGFKRQATSRGDAYLVAKTNQSKQITATGMAEVEGLKKQIAALNGPGGEALLKLEIVKQLMKNKPNFVLIDSSEAKGNLNFNKVDTNELIRQTGLFAAGYETMKNKAKK